MSDSEKKVLEQMKESLQRYGESSGSVSFNFELPSEGLSLRGASIVDGVSKLVFDASGSPNCPTITEEDVAVVVRLVVEGKRPEFFYIPIPLGHPFHHRQYMQYEPQWLKGTSVGELLAEADWTMKCLSIGAQTNADKTKFWAVGNTSNLIGQLGTTLNFPRLQSSGSIKMSCKSAKVKETNDNLWFPSEPEMQIISDASPAYSKYITNVYNSIAHYDEPLYLKMKELIKLILAIEFLNNRGVKFDNEWYMSFASAKPTPSQAVEVSNNAALAKTDLEDLINQLAPPNEKIEVVKHTKSGFQLRRQAEDGTTVTLTMSVDDHDLLYEGLDPKQPISHDGTIIPDVNSWSELYRETVPWPHVWMGDLSMPTAMGGVTTSNIPVKPATSTPYHGQSIQHSTTKRQGVYESNTSHEHVSVESSNMPRSSGKSSKLPEEMMPLPKPVAAIPPRKVGPKNLPKPRGKKSLTSFQYGEDDSTSGKAFSSEGEKIKEYKTLKVTVHKDGEPFGVRATMPLPTSSPSGLSLDSGVGGSPPSRNRTLSPTASDNERYLFVSPIGSDDEMMDHDD